MPKLLASLPVLVSALLLFFFQTVPAYAGGVTVGPFQVNIATGYEARDFDIGKVEAQLWIKSADGKTPMPSGNMEDYYSWELTQGCAGTCLKKLDQEPIDGSPTGRTTISFKLIPQEKRGEFKQTEGRSSGETYEDGKSTGQITYTWTPTGIVTSPIINLVSPVTDSKGKTTIEVSIDLGKGRKDPNYWIVISDTDAGEGIKASIRVVCKNPANTSNPDCFIQQVNEGINQNGLYKPSLMNNQTLLFRTEDLELKNPQYFLVIQGRYFGIINRAIPVRQSVTDDVEPQLSPETIDTKNTSKAQITISLAKGATGKYSIYPPGSVYLDPRIPLIKCEPPKCSTIFQLPLEGLVVGGLSLTIKDESGKVRGAAILKVTGDPKDRPGGPGSSPGNLPQKCSTNPSDPNICTSSGGIRCDTSNGEKRDDGDGIMTAIGCVPTDPQKLISGLFRVGICLGGAAALLLMIGGAFQFITSAGNPDALKSASETFTQAIIGLLVIIFAVLLLQVIGVDILNIPGFGK